MKYVNGLFIILGCCLLYSATASATSLSIGFSDGAFRPKIIQDGESKNNFDFVSRFDLSDLTLSVDEVAQTAHLTGLFEGDLVKQQGGQKQKKKVVGSARGELDLLFEGLDFSQDLGKTKNPVLAIGLKGESTSSGTFSFVLERDGKRALNESIDIFGGFASPDPDNKKYRDIVANAPFNFVLRESGAFDIWVKSLPGETFDLFDKPLRLHGDLHGTAQVPEPASMLLLSAALGGGLLRKKKETLN